MKENVINELLTLKDSFLLNELDLLESEEEENEGTFEEAFFLPTQSNIFNLVAYPMYLWICCEDSPELFDFFCKFFRP